MGVSLIQSITPASVQEFSKEVVATPVYAEEVRELSLEERAKQIASEYGVSFDLMNKIISDESKWQPDAVGDNGKAFGLAQIHLDYHDVTESDAKNPEFALKWLATEILDGKEWQHTVCNCKAETRRLGAKTPSGEITPNTSYPRVGGIVIMIYNGVKHYAYILSVEEDGIHIQETNFQKCERTWRTISFDDTHIVGYWHSVE